MAEDSTDLTSATPRPTARRFGDEDIRRILRVAAEMQERERAGGGDDGGHGLTLEELRQVAREVGIDPRFVDLAARRVELPESPPTHPLLAAPTRWHFRASVPGEIARGDLDRLLGTIRATLHEKGEVSEVWDRIEWSHSEVGSTIVGITSRNGSTEVDVTGVKTEEATVLHALGTVFGGVLGGAGLAAVMGASGAGALPFIGVMAALCYGATRMAWKARSAWWERRLRLLTGRLTEVVHEVVEAASAEESGHAPEDGP